MLKGVPTTNHSLNNSSGPGLKQNSSSCPETVRLTHQHPLVSHEEKSSRQDRKVFGCVGRLDVKTKNILFQGSQDKWLPRVLLASQAACSCSGQS